MSTRISSALAVLLIGACSRGERSAAPTGSDENKIECALHGAASFARDCFVEHREADIIVHHPDGGFRRFDLPQDGKGPATADGSQPARVRPSADGFDVTVGSDRYRFPAALVGADGR